MNCEDCILYDSKCPPKPTSGRLLNTLTTPVDVMIVGHAMNLIASVPFEGFVLIERGLENARLGAYITNLYKCRKGFATNQSYPKPGMYCREQLVKEVSACQPLVIAFMGTGACRPIKDKSCWELPAGVLNIREGGELKMIAFPHPSNPEKRSRDLWNKQWSSMIAFVQRDLVKQYVASIATISSCSYHAR